MSKTVTVPPYFSFYEGNPYLQNEEIEEDEPIEIPVLTCVATSRDLPYTLSTAKGSMVMVEGSGKEFMNDVAYWFLGAVLTKKQTYNLKYINELILYAKLMAEFKFKYDSNYYYLALDSKNDFIAKANKYGWTKDTISNLRKQNPL